VIWPSLDSDPGPRGSDLGLFLLLQALPNQATVDYPSFKLVIVGDGGTGESPSVVCVYVLPERAVICLYAVALRGLDEI
jgi:hypothetical protein